MDNVVEAEFKVQSDSISKISGALAKAQAKMTSAKRTARNPFFNSNYASLNDVWDAVRAPLAEHELAVIQAPIEDVHGTAVITTLAHSSGEWFRSKLYILPKAKDAQSVGSAITYARRYALSAITGISTDDDDANQATAAKMPPKAAPAKAPAQPPAPKGDEPVTMATARLITEISELLGKMNGGDEELMNTHLKVLTKWTDKQTNDEKFLQLADLPGVGQRKPDWLKRVHNTVTLEYQKAFNADGSAK